VSCPPGGGGNRKHLVAARVQFFGDAFDGATLAAASHPSKTSTAGVSPGTDGRPGPQLQLVVDQVADVLLLLKLLPRSTVSSISAPIPHGLSFGFSSQIGLQALVVFVRRLSGRGGGLVLRRRLEPALLQRLFQRRTMTGRS